ncbi:MAG TPA: aldehyde dehydrogenase family protein [Acidimicrobiia bacterium]|nr:aldehyde dehydrogenase family protein [Acidimicrobiia bacterium]
MTDRLDVRKTYKLFVGGEFVRSESGRSYPVHAADGTTLAWAAQGSRKDVRDAVRAARAAAPGWAAKTAYNRGQILYRIAEMLEGRRDQFCDELQHAGAPDPTTEVDRAIDRWVWYAGWTDKIAHVAGTVNSVAGPYFDFTIPEPTGVVAVLAPDAPPLLGLVSHLAPALAAGNTTVALCSAGAPLPAMTLAEVLATSDLPAGVVNLLSGHVAELGPWLAGHLDIDAIDVTGAPAGLAPELERLAADNVKRVVRPLGTDPAYGTDAAQSPDALLATMELKTVWHPKGA